MARRSGTVVRAFRQETIAQNCAAMPMDDTRGIENKDRGASVNTMMVALVEIVGATLRTAEVNASVVLPPLI